MNKKILLSGAKPTGIPHIGNYFGALKQFVDLQDEYETYIMIADYHALTSVHDAKKLREMTKELILTYLGIGLDPEKIILFRQSDVPGHTELTWIFDCLPATTMPYLMRAHAFKDMVAKLDPDLDMKDREEMNSSLKIIQDKILGIFEQNEKLIKNKDDYEKNRVKKIFDSIIDNNLKINVGVFNYPMLMAADILLYDADVVPVGKDQKQHIEYTRDTAQRFNNTFGETFRLPKELIIESVEIVPGTDGRKMSKSYNNVIPLFGTDEEIKKAVMGIVTDSGSDIPTNVYAIHKLFKSEAELKDLYEEKKGKYKDLKEALLADILAFVSPMRERRAKYENDPELVTKILEQGAQKARAKAQAKMKMVRERVGL